MKGFIEILNECPPIIQRINERLGVIKEKDGSAFPDFSKAETVLSVSDYAGENNAGLWDLVRKAVRYQKLDFTRNMEFKKLNKDRERRRILKDFLNTFDFINGLSLTYLIHRNIRYLFTQRSPHTVLKHEGLGDWKPHIAEKILRVIHLQALLVCGLTNEKHKFLWLTDTDAITKDIKSLGRIFHRIFNFYSTHSFKVFGYAVPFENPDKTLDDLLAVPDLVAGALLEYFNQLEESQKENCNFLVQSKSNDILLWLAKENTALKKLVILITPASPNRFDVKFIRVFEKKEGL
jgi:hypothetical protein